ncbi:hypothetical protein KKC08_01335 [Patescibacteria group bacterium]|nr:hypothetical protein [Patescibacteria group bacterium]MCG2702560.1 hypothetical protein [Candidatus Parcubacteria bacterium]MBU4265090.1 hypothetical protein [Patescibacteria group bacterium]MBU4389670.1 hypothetical protein [Patescibacteria group bacterium]MBU4396796.1 hypothetical protein [Patescibacteria group bacterium]
MKTYDLALLTKELAESGILFFDLKTLRDILNIKNEDSFFDVIKRLRRSGVIKKIERNKYLLKGKLEFNDFALANFIYSPSYVSFESALNFHGILSQFPLEISSATTKNTKKKSVEGRHFFYCQIKKSLFWGYVKKDSYLMAVPEKALIDQFYLYTKGLKSFGVDEYDLSLINKRVLKKYLIRIPEIKNKLLKICGFL